MRAFLVGALGRAAIGEAIDVHGYANIFLFTAALGLGACVLVVIEWWRQGRATPPAPEGAVAVGAPGP